MVNMETYSDRNIFDAWAEVGDPIAKKVVVRRLLHPVDSNPRPRTYSSLETSEKRYSFQEVYLRELAFIAGEAVHLMSEVIALATEQDNKK
mgnify:CR=1 FL=1